MQGSQRKSFPTSDMRNDCYRVTASQQQLISFGDHLLCTLIQLLAGLTNLGLAKGIALTRVHTFMTMEVHTEVTEEEEC